eukprot:gene10768-biopygen9598
MVQCSDMVPGSSGCYIPPTPPPPPLSKHNAKWALLCDAAFRWAVCFGHWRWEGTGTAAVAEHMERGALQ